MGFYTPDPYCFDRFLIHKNSPKVRTGMLPSSSTRLTALIVGASGLVGSHLLDYLLTDRQFGEVKALVRRPLSISHPKLRTILFDFELPDASVIQADAIFCCLGTTIRQAGSKAAFRKVDFDYPLQIARFGRANGATAFHLVSSMGADAHAPFFYSQVKGELEEALQHLGYPALYIYRPSLLLGKRPEQRIGEKIGEVVLRLAEPLLRGGLRKYRAIEAGSVAKAMCYHAQTNKTGVFRYESDQLSTDAQHYNP